MRTRIYITIGAMLVTVAGIAVAVAGSIRPAPSREYSECIATKLSLDKHVLKGGEGFNSTTGWLAGDSRKAALKVPRTPIGVTTVGSDVYVVSCAQGLSD